MVVTLDEGEFWRPLSNSGALAFNIGQLEAIDAPANVAQPYTEGLAALEATLDAMSEPISVEDDPGLRALSDQVRGQIEGVRASINQAA